MLLKLCMLPSYADSKHSPHNVTNKILSNIGKLCSSHVTPRQLEMWFSYANSTETILIDLLMKWRLFPAVPHLWVWQWWPYVYEISYTIVKSELELWLFLKIYLKSEGHALLDIYHQTCFPIGDFPFTVVHKKIQSYGDNDHQNRGE